jgi:3',5'-cyclic AMP phosphodiesterase CpdA
MPAQPALEVATTLDEPPPRYAWEEPPAAGWTANWSGFGVGALRFAASAVVAIVAVELALTALEMRHHREGLRHVQWLALWGASGGLGVGLSIYVWRRLRSLFILAAMLTDWGRVARFGGRPPVWLDAEPEEPALRVAHLSDLHVVESERVRLVERAHPGGNAILPRLFAAPELDDAELVLFSGDITDRGTSVSWRCFLDALEERGLTERAVLVPGNHDLAFVEREGAWRHDRFGIVQLANLLKFADAFAATGGGKRGRVLVGDGEPEQPSQASRGRTRPFLDVWDPMEREIRPLVASLPATPVPPLTVRHYLRERGAHLAYARRIDEARERLFSLFPVAVPVGRDAVLFVVNSCASPQQHPATNALGHVGRTQYRRLGKLAALCPEKLRLVTLHHHVVRRAEEASTSLRTRLLAKFTVLHDARPLVRFCREHEVRAVMHGHRHLSYQLRLDCGTVLLAAPSSTLGDELAEDPRPQLVRYDFATAAERHTVGIFRRPVRLRG